MRGVAQLNESDAATEGIHDMLPGFVPEFAVDLAVALIVFLIGWYLSKLIVRLAGRTVARRIKRPSVTRTVLRGIRAAVVIVTLGVAANVLGLSGGQILLQVTVISAVVAVVLAPLVGSLINGFFVLADRPYEIGDMIEVVDQDHRGFVEDITIRYTKVFTLENTFIVIPNSEIQQRDIINYSAEDERTRTTLSFEITYESDLEAARRAAERAARSVDTVISGGPDIRIGSARYAAAPSCRIEEYADDGVALTLHFWVKNPYKQSLVRSQVQEAIHDRFADLDVEFAYPHRHHVFDETSGIARVDGTSADRRPNLDSSPASDPSETSDGSDRSELPERDRDSADDADSLEAGAGEESTDPSE